MLHLTHIHRRLAIATVGAVVLSVTAALPSYAAPPANDSINSPRNISTVPATLVSDSTGATSHPTDGRCALGASVWYRYRPTSTRTLRVVTIGSDYDTVLGVSTGSRSRRTEVACSDDAADLASAVRVRFVKGETYWIVVSACCRRRARGGETVLTLYGGRAAGVHATIDTVESGAISGRLYVNGTVSCDTPSVAFLSGIASQRVGEAVARGFGEESLGACTDEPSDFRMRIDSDTGWAFTPGNVSVQLFSAAVDGFAVAEDEQEDTFPVTDDPNGITSGGHRGRGHG